jgi:hypothetical protein
MRRQRIASRLREWSDALSRGYLEERAVIEVDGSSYSGAVLVNSSELVVICNSHSGSLRNVIALGEELIVPFDIPLLDIIDIRCRRELYSDVPKVNGRSCRNLLIIMFQTTEKTHSS